MLSVFERMSRGVLAVLGEGSLLRGSVACKANVEHGVQVVGSDDQTVVERSIATIEMVYSPKVGDTLQHPDGFYKLDAIFQDNGPSRRFILMKATPP